MAEKLIDDSLWMCCLFELYNKALKEHKKKLEFSEVDALVLECAKVPFEEMCER